MNQGYPPNNGAPQYPPQGQMQQGYASQTAAPAKPKKEAVICIPQGRIIGTVQDGTLIGGGQKRNYKTDQLEFDEKGQPIFNWVIVLAVPKQAMQQDPNGIGRIWTEMWKAYLEKHPNGMQMVDPKTGFPDPKNFFSMKCKDGDLAIDTQGKPYRDRVGYAGHYVLTLSTQIKPQFFIPDGGVNKEVTEGIKVGDYVNVAVQVSSGDSGLYLNPKMVQLVERGAAIVSGPSADDVFSKGQPQVSQFINVVKDPVYDPSTAFNPQFMPAGQGAPQYPPQQQQGFAPPMNQQAPQFQQPQQVAPNYGALPQQQQNGYASQGQPAYQGQFDPNAVGGGQHNPAAQSVGGSPSPQGQPAFNAGPNQYPPNGGMPQGQR